MAKEQTNQPGEMTIDEQLKLIELEERKQALESRKLQDELARITLTEKRQEVETKKNNKERGMRDALDAINAAKAVKERCNHHTGGEGGIAVKNGMGDLDRPTCIGAQKFLDDRIRLTCSRCSDEWWSDDPDRARWARGVELWRKSVNKQMMVVGGLKFTRVAQVA